MARKRLRKKKARKAALMLAIGHSLDGSVEVTFCDYNRSITKQFSKKGIEGFISALRTPCPGKRRGEMRNMEFIGKTCFYRPLLSRDFKTGTVLEVKEFENSSGKKMSLLVMDNGDVENSEACYFPLSSTA